MKLVFATQNLNKLAEIQALAGENFQLTTPAQLGITEEIPETGTTLSENAAIKARYIYDRFGLNCFADDSGLEIDALDGKPGVYSARYAGVQKDPESNIDLVLSQMQNVEDRNAKFKTVICLIFDNRLYEFVGEIVGEILSSRRGTGGFGYDSIFRPHHSFSSFAEMTPNDKNAMSHRAIAFEKLAEFLRKNY